MSQSILLCTTDDFPGGSTVTDCHGLVFSSCSAHAIGQRVSEIKDRALEKLRTEAGKLGANAVIGVRLDVSVATRPADGFSMENVLTLVTAYGTAVSVTSTD
ncbi:heavy metal-binding domain-containing protein [Thiomonas sp.]